MDDRRGSVVMTPGTPLEIMCCCCCVGSAERKRQGFDSGLKVKCELDEIDGAGSCRAASTRQNKKYKGNLQLCLDE